MTSKEEILKRLNKIFIEIFDDESIILTNDTNAEDIDEWDSLNQIKIILACEVEFSVKLNARDISALENIGSMVDHLTLIGSKTNQ